MKFEIRQFNRRFILGFEFQISSFSPPLLTRAFCWNREIQNLKSKIQNRMVYRRMSFA